MQDLRVIGVESGALLVATDAGSEYRLPVTLSLQSQLRQASPDLRSASGGKTAQRVSPREIQSSIRAGRTAEQVAAATGVEVDYVRRFEGPVLDERSFVLDSARAVPVTVVGPDGALGELSRFGDVTAAGLDEAQAVDRTWTSYKEEVHGWVVHVAYTAGEVEREATWRYEPKKQALAPLDGDAHTLSRQDGSKTSLVPRLRAVGMSASGPIDLGDAPMIGESPAQPDESGRFDSGAFELTPEPADTVLPEPPVPFDRTRDGRSAASFAAMNRAPEAAAEHNQTADLLEALRRRRGEREAARFDEGDPSGEANSRAAHPSTGSLRVIDVPLPEFDAPSTRADETDGAPEPVRPATPTRSTPPVATHPAARRGRAAARDDAPEPQRAKSRARKGRASMPSWDEIVFGARSDDDPA